MLCSFTEILLSAVTCLLVLTVISRFHLRRAPELTVKTALGSMKYDELEQCVFMPNNFKVIAISPVLVLDFITKPTCEQIFADWLRIAISSNQLDKAPRSISTSLKKKFSLNGNSFLQELYVDQHATETPLEWKQILQWLNLEESQLKNITSYGEQSMAVYHALNAYPPKNKTGLVIGSRRPWVEVLALRAGAKEITTVEYQKLTIYGTDKVTYIHPIELAQRWREYEEKFDFAISFSSIEHSGLGRYGDPLDPIGDLREIWKTACLLKRDGYFYLGLPRGRDTVTFNLHRIYGKLRLAMVMTGFDWVATYRGDRPEAVRLTDRDLEERGSKQDVFVLKKR